MVEIMTRRKTENMFCDVSDLNNEASVEALFVDRLLVELNYPDNRVLRKQSISQITIGKGSKKENYKPDYALLNSAGEPIIVIDAKSPNETPEKYHYQVSAYALYLNQKYTDKNPVRYTILTNGHHFTVYPWDSQEPVFFLRFEDFKEKNEKMRELRSNISYDVFKQVALTQDVFKFERPELTTLIKTFNEMHNLIRKKDSLSPTDAFYEFSKIMFIKIREDNKIHDILEDDRSPKKDDFTFSTQWIDRQASVETNPFNAILFRQIQEELEKKIQKGEKKRIFENGERLSLKSSTIYEIVKSLQHYDLYAIDEDLNGRMFETFLNATVRGKELGQFFTPRGVVHYMVETATMNVTVKHKEIQAPFILDGCCGSGGFLIDAMATIIDTVDKLNHLTETQKDEYKDAIKRENLYGIDSTEKISRIARLNMYLHGDGGSKIFKADSLDHDYTIDEGMVEEEKEGLRELKNTFTSKNKLEFDVVLTNPPFSISYKKKDANENRILEQYEIAKTTSGASSSSEKSNVLFIERYKDLLKSDGGELLTVIDDTVLNGDNSQQYRDFIFKNFIIIQIISLPFNTFFRAQANIKTSLIHLRRKHDGEEQGDIFMSITNNIGHDDHQRDTPARNNLPTIAMHFHEWQETGKRFEKIIDNQHDDEPLGCPLQIFTITPKLLNPARLDAFYYSPELKEARAQVTAAYKQGKINLKTGSDFTLIPPLRKEESKECEGKWFKYFEIGDVTIDGSITDHREDYFENLPTRARLKVEKHDVIFAKNNSSRGTTVLIPEWYAGNLTTTGFLGIRPHNYEESLLLWSIMESEFFRKQIYYLAITASQPEVRESIFNTEFIIPYPKTEEQKKNIIEKAQEVDKARNNLKNALNKTKDIVQSTFFV